VEAGRRWVEHAAAPAGDGNRAPSPPADVADVGTPGPVTDGAAPPSAGPLAPVLRTLRTAGFAPELSADGSRIDLHHCPFLEVAREHPDVVCGAHLGLIQGELARLGSPATATRLVPFERPGVCSAHLAVHLAVPLESRERAQ
ncbi:hypothetical protein ICW40_18275, partial [Actinotalea ferrariae]|nr:hypothetical protein [Actinotalea ferrariae]